LLAFAGSGSVALDLAYVAAGRFDGFWEDHLAAWDIAAGLIMIREAGGFTSDTSGGQNMLTKGSICAGNEHIHKALLKTIAKPV
jgi:myo-inositol-1(or 4)-monophosphatase